MTAGDSRSPIGMTIAGRYQLRAVLGRGGMATVYRAYQPALDREVAVKLIDPHLETDPTFGERFRLEGRIVARLRHPNILTIYDFGEEAGSLYLVTELIEGGTLQARLGEIRAFAQALDIVEQVGRALDYAHAQGIVHRDVKPANVFIEGDRAILADFGIAKVIAGTTEAGLTATGAGIGTPEYIAPEQLLGQPVDGRADLYALAVMLYRLMAGRLPYRLEGPQDTTLALVMRKVNGPPPAPSTFNPVISPTLDAILLRALARDPAERYPTAAALTAAVRGALGLGTPRPTSPTEGMHTVATTSLPTVVGPPSQTMLTSPTPATPVTPPSPSYQPLYQTPPPQPPPYQQAAYQQPAYQQPAYQQPAYQPPQGQGPGVPYPPVPPRRNAPIGLLAVFGVLAVLLIAVAAGAFVLSRNVGKTTGKGGTTGVTPSVTVSLAAGGGGPVTPAPSPGASTPPTNTPIPPTTTPTVPSTVPPTVLVAATPPTPTTPPPTVTPTVPPTEVPPTEVPPTEVPPTAIPPTMTPPPPPPTPTPTVRPPTATPPPPAANVRAIAQQAILSLPGTSSGVFIDLANSANNASDDPDRVLPAASLIKLPIAGAAYQRVAEGQWRLTDVFTVTNAVKVGGTGIVQNQPAGTTYSLDQLVEIMLVYSDNTAANMILDKLGGFAAVNAFSTAQGMNNTVMRRRLFDLAAQQRGVDNTTTSGDIARYFVRLQAGQLINPTYSDRIRTILARRGREDKNWALLNLPANLVALHMSGTGAGNRNDAIVVTIGNQQYILVLMVVDPNEAGMEQAIARVSATIYGALTGR